MQAGASRHHFRVAEFARIRGNRSRPARRRGRVRSIQRAVGVHRVRHTVIDNAGLSKTYPMSIRCVTSVACLGFVLVAPAVVRAGDKGDKLVGTWVWRAPPGDHDQYWTISNDNG